MLLTPVLIFTFAIALVPLCYRVAKRCAGTQRERIGFWLLCMLCVVAGAASWVAFGLLGSEVDEHGRIHEPFGLLPIGTMLATFGATGALVRLIVVCVGTCFKKQKRNGE